MSLNTKIVSKISALFYSLFCERLSYIKFIFNFSSKCTTVCCSNMDLFSFPAWSYIKGKIAFFSV